MENASKALLIAAAVLVVIILIAFGMKIYTSSSETEKVATDTGKTISEKTEDASDIAISEITGKKLNKNIKYYQNLGESNEKQITVEEAGLGDSFKIGEEKFMIFSKTSTEIKAMPYYNLKLDSDPIIQATAETAYSSGESWFSTSKYWDDGDDTIYMGDSRNIIQDYITRYRTTLEGYGAVIKDVRAPICSELNAEGVTTKMRNPKNSDNFWVGSDNTEVSDNVWVVTNTGGLSRSSRGNNMGTRPIIIISI